MAFAARLGALTEELITVITSTSNQNHRDRFNVYRETTLRKLRHHNSLRTNQFDIESQLNGLEEKFRVLNRDGLADSLRQRLDVLSETSSEWTPELLHLLLDLSDQPVQKSKLVDLELLREPEEDTGPPLTWEDIAKDDGWTGEQDLWRDVDFGEGSSDEDEYGDSEADTSGSKRTSISSNDHVYSRRPDDFVISSDDTQELRQVQDTQAWRHLISKKDLAGKTERATISEIQMLREVLFMLGGLHTSLFDTNGNLVPSFQLYGISWEAHRAVTSAFGEAGRSIATLRKFAVQQQQVPLMQVFQDSVEKRLQDFDAKVAATQSRFVDIHDDTVVSLIQVHDELRPRLEPLRGLADMIEQLQQEPYARSFRYLELLFDAAGTAQLEGNESTYDFFGRMFFDCFQVYLRPMRLWMEEGQLMTGDDSFFVSKSATQVPLSQVWQDQFNLRRSSQGMLHAPRFLNPAASRIFTTGKSVVVLKHLGRYEMIRTHETAREPSLTYESVCASDPLLLAPFPELFASAFDEWIQSKHHTTSRTLQRFLFDSCGLWSTLDALHLIYFMKDGARSDVFASAIFNNLDLLNPNWHDRFTLTEIAQEAFDSVAESYRINVRTLSEDNRLPVATARRSVRNCLPGIRLHYQLAWPIQLVLSVDATASYQQVFTVLLQLRRATSMLQRGYLLKYGRSQANGSDEEPIYHGLRAKLLWFCNTLQTYLTSLVLDPLITKIREDLRKAEDVDAMVSVHTLFTKQVLEEACLGSKLTPIRECILDILDLTIRLEDARQLYAQREAEDTQEPSRLSGLGSSQNGSTRQQIYVDEEEEEDSSFFAEQAKDRKSQPVERTYMEELIDVRRDFDRHLRFITGGLRGVARASSDSSAAKWDTLAEMLELGIREQNM